MTTATEILSAAFPTVELVVDGNVATATVDGRVYTVATYATGAISVYRGPLALYVAKDTVECAVAALVKDAGRETIDFPRELFV